ncbi:MAG: ABC transporter permease [Eubacteriales bacterium]
MKTFLALTKRNIKMFFKDKGMFFTSLITPVILLVLYATFLASVYHDSFVSSMPDGFSVPEKLINATVGGELISSLLAVSCVTVAFCSNLLMVQDKISGARKDMLITPVKKPTLAISYYVASLLTTLIISYTAMAAGFIYLAIRGWYLSFTDVILVIVDVFLLTMFGVAISSVVNVFLSTQGQASAVGTIVSAGYGFICGAYMPISNFGEGLRNVLSFLPGTYATSIIRNHCLNGVYNEMSEVGMPSEVIENIKSSIDCNLYFFGNKVEIGTMYVILISSIILLIGAFVLINALWKKKN